LNVPFRSSFLKDIKGLTDKALKGRIKAVISQVEAARILSEIGNLKKLKGSGDYYRIRIGLICKGDNVTFVRCLHRREIYRYLP
jgi:mRNA interferase RelE/StbE